MTAATNGNEEQVAQLMLERDDFVADLADENPENRERSLRRISELFISWAREDNHAELRKFLPSALRLQYDCPYLDVRLRMSALVDELRSMGVNVPVAASISPSRFIPESSVVPFNSEENAEAQELLEAAFLKRARTSRMFRIMCFYPRYARRFRESLDCMLYGPGPLPLEWRSYIAIMAASRYHCHYLITILEPYFLADGGTPEWLRGVDHAPAKLQRLGEINAILAHQPWLLTPQTIRSILVGEDSWGIAELTQAIVIMVTYHALAGFVLGCGIAVEVDRLGGTRDEDDDRTPGTLTPAPRHETDTESAAITAQLLTRLRMMTVEDEEEEEVEEDARAEGREKQGDEGETPQTLAISTTPRLSGDDTDGIASPPVNGMFLPARHDYSRYFGQHAMQHADFVPRSDTYKTFRLEDSSWESHGFSLLERYYPEMAPMLDDIFTDTTSLTDHTLFEHGDVDTLPFRQAIWYYTLQIKGMKHDDFNYQKVNECLNVNFKRYIKNVACYPQSIKAHDFQSMRLTLYDREKVHINFLILEARRQSGLLYALCAIMRHHGD